MLVRNISRSRLMGFRGFAQLTEDCAEHLKKLGIKN